MLSAIIGLSLLSASLIGFVFYLFKKNQIATMELLDLKTNEARTLELERHTQQSLQEERQKNSDLNIEIATLREDNSQLKSQVHSSRELMDREKKLLEEAKSSFQDAFTSLASKALEGNNKQFIELAKSVLGKESATSKVELEKKQQAIEELLRPLSTSLEKYQTELSQVEKHRIKAYSEIESELKKVQTTHEELSKNTQALKDALKKPHVRGRWGEVQLKNCIDIAGMSEYADVDFQDSTTLDSGKILRPDMIVRMPGNKKVIVDCKTPIDAFLASLEANSEEERHTEMVRHGKHVKKHILDLSLKDYAKEIRGSADFTVMFLPNESFLYAALEIEPDLVEFAMQKKILIATPPTLIGLLKVIRYGWNEEMLAENAHKISEAGKELHKRVCDFVEAYESIGRHLEKARDEYDKGLTRLNRRVLVQTRKLETLGAKGAKELPEGAGFEAIEGGQEL